MMKNAFLACILLASCTPGSKSTAVKEKESAAIIYPYSSIYKSVGTVYTDTTTKRR